MASSGTAATPTPYPALSPMIILISTKAFFTPTRTLSYLESILDPSNGILPLPAAPSRASDATSPPLQLVLLPDFLTIYPCTDLLARHSKSAEPSSWPLLIGAQDCFWEHEPGPFTGEIIPAALRSLGCSVVELGHVERRRHHFETDETTARKAAAVSRCGMVPLVCIGEESTPRIGESMSMAVGNAFMEIGPQITTVLRAVPRDAPLILAYEPVWAAERKRPVDLDYAWSVIQAIKEFVGKVLGWTGQVRVVYGGDVWPGFWGMTRLTEYIDGIFLGPFAHEISGLKDLIEETVEAMTS